MFYRPGEEEFEADLDENELEENQDKPKKHKIVARGNIKNFTKQQIKDAIFTGAFTLGMFMINTRLNAAGLITYAAVGFVGKKVLNVAGKKLFGKKHNIIKREKAAAISDIAKMTISAASIVTPVLLGASPITLGLAAGGAITLALKVALLIRKDKKLNKEIDQQNRNSRKAAREQARQEREQNRSTEEDQNEDEFSDQDVDENVDEDENQNQNGGRTR